ncbi:MAG: type II secretion system major pseudopilin GspG [Spirochaetes bacterium]|nr:type II secretion system major pseudopilin GspG [Spirochaetota bacterium]
MCLGVKKNDKGTGIIKDVFRAWIAFGKKEAGFTLIEIMVASVVLLILISVTGFVISKQVEKARVISCRNQIHIFSMALNAYFLDCEIYPTTEQGLGALWERPVFEPMPENWNGPYIDSAVPRDPWSNAYQYFCPGSYGLPFGIRSLGADGREGADDINSWER